MKILKLPRFGLSNLNPNNQFLKLNNVLIEIMKTSESKFSWAKFFCEGKLKRIQKELKILNDKHQLLSDQLLISLIMKTFQLLAKPKILYFELNMTLPNLTYTLQISILIYLNSDLHIIMITFYTLSINISI